MALVNTTVKNRVWINGIEVTEALISGSVSDDSAYSGSIITSRGDLTFSNWAGTQNMLDFDRTVFPPGSSVIVAAELPNGNIVRHPRGLLFVMNSNIDLQARTITFNVGCSLALLSENESNYRLGVAVLWGQTNELIVGNTQLESLDLAQLASILEAEGKIVFQNPYGYIWSARILDDLDGSPVMVVSDTGTAIDIGIQDSVDTVAPLGYIVTAVYQKVVTPVKVTTGPSGGNTPVYNNYNLWRPSWSFQQVNQSTGVGSPARNPGAGSGSLGSRRFIPPASFSTPG